MGSTNQNNYKKNCSQTTHKPTEKHAVCRSRGRVHPCISSNQTFNYTILPPDAPIRVACEDAQIQTRSQTDASARKQDRQTGKRKCRKTNLGGRRDEEKDTQKLFEG